jgi:hypothetical protein
MAGQLNPHPSAVTPKQAKPIHLDLFIESSGLEFYYFVMRPLIALTDSSDYRDCFMRGMQLR